MRKGLARFEFYLSKLETLFAQSVKEPNPALWLYNNDARTPLFMLEGLAKLYAALHNEKKFSKIKERFKVLEDALGDIDYYDSFAKEFGQNKTASPAVIEYLQTAANKKVQALNELLLSERWIGEEARRIKKIREKLMEADWMKDEKEVAVIAQFYNNAIAGIKQFAADTKCKFTELETEVHEIRRQLRWLSIYPKALQGVIQLTEDNNNKEQLQKYLTDEVINSPFNKMPDAGDNSIFLLLEKNNFYALSWMISNLGKLKDSGLRIIAITEAIQQTRNLGRAEALALAYHSLGDQQQNMAAILHESSAICNAYFNEKNLDHLVAGIAAVKKEK